MNQLQSIWNFKLINTAGGVLISIGDIVLVVVIIYAGYLLSRFIEFLVARKLDKTALKPDAVIVIKRISFYSILILVSITIMSRLGIPITAFAFATGAVAIGIGFGAQNIINNFISGWILIAERPIRVGDFIELDSFQGTVRRVGTRSTLMHRLDGVHVLVPNSKLLENTVVNWTLIDGLIRTTVRVGVAYGSNPNQVIELMKSCVVSSGDVLTEPAPEFIFEDFGDNALIFDAYFWCDISLNKSLRSIRSDIRLAISSGFNQAGIVIAFPQRDIHLHADKPIAVHLQK